MSKKKNKNKNKQKQKEKVIYYDDNSTIADMSQVNDRGKKRSDAPPRRKSTFKEKWKTYWAAVKMMLLPTCIALAAIAVLFTLILLLN